MSLKRGSRRVVPKTSRPISCGWGRGIPKDGPFPESSNIGGSRLTLRVLESFTPRTKRELAATVVLLLKRNSAPRLACWLEGEAICGSGLKVDGDIPATGGSGGPP